MNTPEQNLQQVARAALNELQVCKQTLFQMEALFASIKNARCGSTADNLVDLGLAVTGDIGNLMDGHLCTLEPWYAQAISAPRFANPENVARESEVQP